MQDSDRRRLSILPPSLLISPPQRRPWLLTLPLALHSRYQCSFQACSFSLQGRPRLSHRARVERAPPMVSQYDQSCVPRSASKEGNQASPLILSAWCASTGDQPGRPITSLQARCSLPKAPATAKACSGPAFLPTNAPSELARCLITVVHEDRRGR